MSLFSLAILAAFGLALIACGLYWRREALTAVGMLVGGFGIAVFILKWATLGFPP